MSIAPQVITQADIDHYPPETQKSILAINADLQERWDYWMASSRVERSESGHVTHIDHKGHIMCGLPVDYFFGLTYASWLALPRVSLQEMPADWQAKFVALIEEARDKHGMRWPEDTVIMRTGERGRFVDNRHWNNYRRGTMAQAVATDEARGLDVV